MSRSIVLSIIFCFVVLLPGSSQAPGWSWIKVAHTNSAEESTDVSVDSAAGEIVIVGTWENDLSLFYGDNSRPSTDFTSTYGGRDGFVAKYDTLGNYIWAFTIGGPQNDDVGAVSIDPSGNIYITGQHRSGLVQFSGTSSLTADSSVNNAFNIDHYVAKYNSDGALIWVKSTNTGASDKARGYAIYATDSAVYSGGYYEGDFDMGPYTYPRSAPNEDVFLLKQDSDGNVLWMMAMASDDTDRVRDIVADSEGVYVVGTFRGLSANFYDIFGGGAGNIPNNANNKDDVFISSYTAKGNFKWARGIGSVEDDYGRGIAMDSEYLYVTGAVDNNALFPGYLGNPVPVVDDADIFLSRHAKNSGQTSWVRVVEGNDNFDDIGMAVTRDIYKQIYISGYYKGTLNFFGDTTLTSVSNQDLFLASFFYDGTFNWAKSGGSNNVGNSGNGVATDLTDHIYLTGSYEGQGTFDAILLPDDNQENIFLGAINVSCVDAKSGSISSTNSNICPSDSAAIILDDHLGIIHWQSSPPGLNLWSDVPGKNDTIIYVSPTITTDYRAYITSGDCLPDSSNIISIVVFPAVTATLSGDTSICPGTSAALHVDFTGTSPWDFSYTNGSDTTDLTGITDNPYSLIETPTGSVIYNPVKVEDGNGCFGSVSGSADVTVLPASAANLTGDALICIGDTTQLQVELSGIASWDLEYENGTDTFLLAGIPLNPRLIDVFPSVTTTYELVSLVDGNGCFGIVSGSAIVTAQPPPPVEPGKDSSLCGLTFQFEAILLAGSGTWSKTSGPGSALFTPGPGQPNATVTVDAYGSYDFTWTVTSGPCTVDSSITIQFYEIPVADPGVDSTLCGLFFQFEAVPSVGSGIWSQSSGPGTGIFTPGPGNPDAEVTVDAYGSYVFTWTETNVICSDDTSINIDFYEIPVADAGLGSIVCGLTAGLQANPSVGTGTWTVQSGPGSAVFNPDMNDPFATVTVDAYGSYQFLWTEVNGTCSDGAIVTVEFYEIPVADPGADDDTCGLQYILNGTPGPGTGSWSQTAGPGTSFFTPSDIDPNAEVTVDAYGTYEFTRFESNGPCNDDSTVTITFFQPVIADPGYYNDTCGLEMDMQSAFAGTSVEWNKVSGPGNVTYIPDEFTPGAKIIVDQYGMYEFMWLVMNGTCSDDSIISVTFYEQPIADPGAGGDICGPTFPLSAVTSVGNGVWTKLSGPGTVLFSPSPNIPTATASVSVYGSYELTWTETNGTCSDESTITINFYEFPTINAGPGGTTCGLEYTFMAVPSVGTGAWNVDAGPGTGIFSPSDNDPNATLTVDSYGTYTVSWTEINGPCSPAMAIFITFEEVPMANAGSDGDECDLDHNLRALPSVGTGTWTYVPGPGTAIFSPDENSALATVTVDSYGNYQMIWTEDNGTCSDADTVHVEFYQIPLANAGSGGDVCGTSFRLSALPSRGIGTWTTTSGFGIAQFDPNENDPVATVTVSQPGSYEFSWTEENGPCTDASSVTVNFLETPIADPGPGGQICGLEYVLQANPGGGSGTWTQISGSGTAIFSPNANTPGAMVTVNTYDAYSFNWNVTGVICSDDSSITVEFFEQPLADAGPDQELEAMFETFLDATIPVAGTGKWEVVKGLGELDDDNDPKSYVSVLSIGENIFIWTVTQPSCPEATDSVSIVVGDLVVPSVVTPNNDGKNDVFTIPGIENHGPVDIIVFNRWGNEIYSSSDFQNSWEGKDQKGRDLPADTYFYILTLQSGRVLKGYVVIKR